MEFQHNVINSFASQLKFCNRKPRDCVTRVYRSVLMPIDRNEIRERKIATLIAEIVRIIFTGKLSLPSPVGFFNLII